MYAATYERGLEVTNLKTGQMISYLNNPKDSTTIHSSKIFKLMKASTDFSINSLAQELNMSRTSVFTKIKGIMGMTPNDFIKVTKLKTAAKLLAEGKYRISEITYIVGFSSSSYFAKCFQKQFGILPTDFVKSLKGNE